MTIGRLGEFQPADTPEPDHDALWDSWFEQQEKNGYAVISRDEWHAKLDEAARDGYAEGRKDERDEWAPVLAALLQLATATAAANMVDAGQRLALERAKAAIAAATGSAS